MSSMCIEEDEDTIVEEHKVQSIIDKYKIFGANDDSDSVDKVIILSDDDCSVPNKDGSISTNKETVSGCYKTDDDVDDLLAELSKKYNVDNDWKNSGAEFGFQKQYNATDDEPPIPNFEVLSDDSRELPVVNLQKPVSDKTSNSSKMKKQQEKQAEKERKKEEAQRSKEIKKAMQTAMKNLRPEESVKFITALIDNEILNSFIGNDITSSLGALGSSYRVQSQLVPNTVTWTRKTDSHSIDETGKLITSTSTEDTEQILEMMLWNKFVVFVHENTLLAHVRNIQAICRNKRITLGIFGMQGYFRGNYKVDKVPKLKRRNVEFCLTELQILCDVCYRFLDKPEDVGAMISQFTKSVAQAPFKLQKQEKHLQAEWYMSGDNKDCVKVDKFGNGLQRLWQQQLTSFPMARIETAEAIINQYPTLVSLMEGYESCATESEKEKLVQEIQIRRAAGPLTNNRKIGPELSKKMYAMYNSLDGNTIL